MDLNFIVVAKDQATIKQLQKEVYAPGFADIAIDWIFKTKESFDIRKNIGGFALLLSVMG